MSQRIQLVLCQQLQNCVVTNLQVMHQLRHELPHYFLGNVPTSLSVGAIDLVLLRPVPH